MSIIQNLGKIVFPLFLSSLLLGCYGDNNSQISPSESLTLESLNLKLLINNHDDEVTISQGLPANLQVQLFDDNTQKHTNVPLSDVDFKYDANIFDIQKDLNFITAKELTQQETNIIARYKGLVSEPVSISVIEDLVLSGGDSKLIIVSPKKNEFLSGTTVKLTAMFMIDGEVLNAVSDVTNLSDNITWKSSNQNIASVSQGNVTLKGDGLVDITAMYGNNERIIDTITLKAIVKDTKDLMIIASTEEPFVNQTVTFETQALHSDLLTTNISNDVSYSVHPNDAVIEGNKIKFNSTGYYTVTSNADFLNKTKEIDVYIHNHKVKRLLINTSSNILNIGDKQEIVVFAILDNDRLVDITDDVYWKYTSSDSVSVDNGYIVAKKSGTVQLSAIYNQIESPSVSIVVENSEITNLMFRKYDPNSKSYFNIDSVSLDEASSNSFFFDVFAFYNEHDANSVAPENISFSWMSNDDLVVAVNNTPNNHFMIQNVSGFGEGTLTAKHNGSGLKADLLVKINSIEDKKVKHFVIEPKTTLHLIDSKAQFIAKLGFEDGSAMNVEPTLISWSSSDLNQAIITEEGVASYIKEGEITFTAKYYYGDQLLTATLSIDILPFVVEELVFTQHNGWKGPWRETVARGEILDFWAALSAVLSNGESITLTLDDVTVTSKLGLWEYFNERGMYMKDITDDEKEVVTIHYAGKSVELPHITVIEPTHTINSSCNSSYAIRGVWGVPCNLTHNGYTFAPRKVLFSTDESGYFPVRSSYTFATLIYFQHSELANNNTKVTLCSGDNAESCNTTSRYINAVDTSGIKDVLDKSDMLVKTNASTPIKTEYTIYFSNKYTGVNHYSYIHNYNMFVEDKTLGSIVNNSFIVTRDITGTTSITKTIISGEEVNDRWSSAVNLHVSEPNYRASDSITLDGSVLTEGMNLPDLVSMTLVSPTNASITRTDDITSNLTLDFGETGFYIKDGKLFFEGSVLPGEIKFHIVGAKNNYLDILEQPFGEGEITIPIDTP